MEEIKDFNQTAKDNKIIVDSTKSTLDSNSVIKFNGKNNILVIEDGVKLVNSRISFGGDNAVVYLSRNKYIYYLDINAYSNTCVFIGKDNFFNGRLSLIASERKNIIIGDNGLISFGIFVRTADPHLIYSCETKQRINKSKSVLIGDHVWLGQGALILKGTKIADKFTKIFACNYVYDENGEACWPKMIINYTSKTQCLFRISKGVLDIREDNKVNEKIADKHVEFENMVYIGDGITDIPCMKLIREKGGKAIALYPSGCKEKVSQLVADNRINYVCVADYSQSSTLEKIVKLMMENIAIFGNLKEREDKQLAAFIKASEVNV